MRHDGRCEWLSDRGSPSGHEIAVTKSMSVRAWVCWLALMTTTVDGANQPVTMKISPAVSFAPASLIIRTSWFNTGRNEGAIYRQDQYCWRLARRCLPQ